ncbi:sensor histidine kinase [Ascidiimonas aurantiaca]|uniref:sensor histidine kinase n=1 Tax=Ascidiimonas aurantiaca TaxID=1685432 RepID=UPI0030ED0BEA
MNYETFYDYFIWQFVYASMVMLVIGVNHFLLIPYFLDRKRYILYVILLLLTIYLGIQLKSYGKDLGYSIKVFLIFTYITGTGLAFFFLKRSITFQKENAEKEKLQKETELNYLKEQVNPHFLFNSLNSIYSLSKSQSPETPELVMQLSELIRYQLESAKKDKVSLKEELEFIENYLLLEEKRLSERCTIEFIISEYNKDLNIAPMLLIPFVENAVKHGAQVTNEKSKIEVRADVNGNRFDFSVTNTKPKDLKENKRKGIGLENVKKRLNLLYANLYVLEILDKDERYDIHLSIQLSNELKLHPL